MDSDKWEYPTGAETGDRRKCPRCGGIVSWHAYGQYWGCLLGRCSWHYTPEKMTVESLQSQLTQLRAENEYFKSERDALDESRIAFVKEAYKLLGIEDDGEYRWKWVLLGIHSLKEERDEAVGLLKQLAESKHGFDCMDVADDAEAFLTRHRAGQEQTPAREGGE